MIVGNAPEEVLIPLLEQYIATLPADGKKETYINTGDVPVKGDRKVHYYKYKNRHIFQKIFYIFPFEDFA